MCGVAGLFAYRDGAGEIDRGELRRIRDHMQARGPDGSGEWFSADGRVALGHRRLAIIDLSDRATQPMASADRSCLISFNGEIYNYRALRSELERDGVRFRTESDTEVLLVLYERFGEQMFGKLRGMYAFVLWDARRRSMLLARDPYGIKPLYYADDGSTVRVASQVKALRAGGAISAQYDPAGLVGFLLLGSVPEPRTCFSQIRSVPAGAWLRVDRHGIGDAHRHFVLAREYREAPHARGDEATAAHSAKAALRDSVMHHLVADVPVGAFLSAGVDSGGIVGVASDLSQRPLRTITLQFEEFGNSLDDEAPLAAATAQRYGTEHTTRVVHELELQEDLPRILEAMDQPSIDGINTWFVAKASAERGLKVALSGLGGDELLGGYPSFRSLPRWVATMSVPSRIPLLGRTLRVLLSPILRLQSRITPKLAGIVEWGGTWEGAYLLRRGLFMPWELSELLPADMLQDGLERLDWRRVVHGVIDPDPQGAFAHVACLESGLYMRNQLLRDTDWASMAHSLEVRTPLVDVGLARAMTPLVERTSAGITKRWLAQAPSKPLPDSVITRRKTGFQTPIAGWMPRIPGFDIARKLGLLPGRRLHWSRAMALNVLVAAGFGSALQRTGTSRRPVATAAPRVVHMQRKPFAISYSVERIFHDVREHVARVGTPIAVRINRCLSKGFLPRLIDIIGAWRAQGDVNHVTGDVHYLTYLLDPARTVLTVLDCVTLRRLRGFKRGVFWLLWYWIPLRRCRYVTVISEFTKRELLASVRIPERRIVVVHPSLSDEFAPVPLEFNAQRPRLLQIGTGANKNLERVVRAVQEIECELVIVGPLSAAQRGLLQAAQISYRNSVDLTRQQLRVEYEQADILVFASTYEGFGLPIIEANAVGRPVVTSNVCSMPEVAADAACIVDPFDETSISAGVRRVIEDAAYRQSLIDKGYNNARRFRIPAVADEYAALYRRVHAERLGLETETAWPRNAR